MGYKGLSLLRRYSTCIQMTSHLQKVASLPMQMIFVVELRPEPLRRWNVLSRLTWPRLQNIVTNGIITGTVRSCPLPWLPVLSNMQPPCLRCKASTDKLVAKALLHPEWGLHKGLTCHPPKRLKSRHPLWEDMVPIDITARWR